MQKICNETSYWMSEADERVLIFFKAGSLARKVIRKAELELAILTLIHIPKIIKEE